MISPLILSLSNRFDCFLNLTPEAIHAILATCFHPKFKLRWLPEITTDREKKRIQNLMKLIVVQNKVVQKLNPIQVQSQSQNLLLFFLLNQTSSDNSQLTSLNL